MPTHFHNRSNIRRRASNMRAAKKILVGVIGASPRSPGSAGGMPPHFHNRSGKYRVNGAAAYTGVWIASFSAGSSFA
jgi:hypothetical protein